MKKRRREHLQRTPKIKEKIFNKIRYKNITHFMQINK